MPRPPDAAPSDPSVTPDGTEAHNATGASAPTGLPTATGGSKATIRPGAPGREASPTRSTAIARATLAASTVALLLGARPTARRPTLQLPSPGCLFTALIACPLIWGRFTFTASTGAGRATECGSRSRKSWTSIPPTPTPTPTPTVACGMFHGVDLAAVLVIACAGSFPWPRMRDRTGRHRQRFAYEER
ncbi:hypothetical protein AB0G35_06725 [Streptomyces sp. NPDC021749]|uniref:hypothetical protein n=1 Tax=Streptomyces sp. NPDC021749 TaxID=3154905 RepID=UPI0033CD1417